MKIKNFRINLEKLDKYLALISEFFLGIPKNYKLNSIFLI